MVTIRQPVVLEMRMNVFRGPEGGFVMVPGCEPTSTLTSTTMQAEIMEQDLCDCSIVNVRDIMQAIPGSRLEFIPNNGREGTQQLLILPAVSLECPFPGRPDFYTIFRQLCREPSKDEVEIIKGCDSFSISQYDQRPEWRQQL